MLFDVLPVSNVALGTHGRNIAPCGIICRVCHKWSSKEWWGWFVLLLYLIVEDIEELSHYLELLL